VASLVVTPELSLCGYPRRLAVAAAFLDACAAELHPRTRVHGVAAIVGFPEVRNGKRHNAAAVIRDGGVHAIYRKECLRINGVRRERYSSQAASPACSMSTASAAP